MAKFTDAEVAFLKRLCANQTAPGSAWAAEDLKKAVDAGITTGERPQDILTREQGAIMCLRAIEKVAGEQK